jgi:nucleoside-triphosphatase THEP1
VVDARYDSNYSMAVKRRGCTADTRKNILKDIQDWAEDSNSTSVYWMSGMAGTGKTTILFSLCEWLSKKQRLGGSYFCSRISASCRDVNTIVPTLTYQLARYSPAFRSALCKVLEENPEASRLDVKWQFEKLLQLPIQSVKTAMPEGVVVVIDALDECDDGHAFGCFLKYY